jgi:hypothetical protein
MGNQLVKFDLWRVQGTVLARMEEEFDLQLGQNKLVVAEKWDLSGATATFEHGANVSSSSAAKVLMWGVFALGSTFNKNKVYIVVEWPDGKSVLIEGNAKHERDARIFAMEINENSGASKVTVAPNSQAEVLETLKKLGELRDAGVVTEDEFEAKKKELLSRL